MPIIKIYPASHFVKAYKNYSVTKGSIKYFTSVKYFVCHPELVSGSIDAESSSA